MTDATKHIAIVCPGGPITRELAAKVGEIAAQYGAQCVLHFHEQCFETAGHFAGDDAARSAAFLDVANDPAIDSVWFGRGGYGACRLDPSLFGKLNQAARRKTYLGYSDAGALLGRLYREQIGRPVHGPMPTDLPRENGETAICRALDFLVKADDAQIELSASDAQPVVAFNITVLAHLVSTDWAPDLSGHIVLLEDVGEYLYRTDRAMFAIMNSTAMSGAAGVKLGRLSDVPENDRPFGATDEEIFRRWCDATAIPFLGRADIGHDADNKIVPFGRVAQASA